MDNDEIILVVGATGNVGRAVVTGLADLGARVRAVVRRPELAQLADGVDVVGGDLTAPDRWADLLAGVGKVFLLWPLLTAEAAPALVRMLAKEPRHVVYLSATSVRDDRPPAENGFWGQVEHEIEQSGLDWTFLRAGGFAANTLGWAEQIRTTGVVRWPYGGAARSLIHERDLAAVAVRALTSTGHVGRTYALTGPAAITQREQARLIGDAIGRPVGWAELAPADARRQLVTAWGDESFVDGALAYWASLVANPEPVTDTVERLTGAPARTFRQWAVDHADDFR